MGSCAQARRIQEHTVQEHKMGARITSSEPFFIGFDLAAFLLSAGFALC